MSLKYMTPAEQFKQYLPKDYVVNPEKLTFNNSF